MFVGDATGLEIVITGRRSLGIERRESEEEKLGISKLLDDEF